MNVSIPAVQPVDALWIERAEQHQRTLTKPPGSLGRLEEIVNRICAIQETLQPCVDNPTVLVFAADHGVCEEGVNPYPQSVTRQMLANFLAGGAAINAVSKAAGAKLLVVDMGVIGEPMDDPRLISRRVVAGSRNICREPAMSHDEALEAIAAGIDCAEQAISTGSKLLVIGEMGIGNTTIASAVCAALTGAEPSAVCGRGTGSDDAGLQRKRDAIARALTLHGPHVDSPLDLLARLGGLEIAAMCGVCLAAARNRCPVLMDGFISTTAAAIAVHMSPHVSDYLFAGHESPEPGHRVLLDHLALRPILQLDMRLGEGTGAALAIPILKAAVEAFRSMATFASAGVSSAKPEA
ncbi:MAG: nicotinate-nucleotide--dimethylbenzimidazole phosphoribosyltransferase [Acidobacteriaceae bacterium]|nr:nicotinate-nucleotide--dimethylbenzimidazole phosphoribosyltransferase [Acidobacteriaceae bacterium]